MMRKMIIVILCFISFECKTANSCNIVEIEVRYISWSIVRNTPIPVEAFWHSKNPQISGIDTLLIKDKKTFSEIESIISEMYSKNQRKEEIDVRISCLIKYNNCSNDTLSFGRTNKMQFNSNVFPINQNLFSLFFSHLPEEHKELIRTELKNL